MGASPCVKSKSNKVYFIGGREMEEKIIIKVLEDDFNSIKYIGSKVWTEVTHNPQLPWAWHKKAQKGVEDGKGHRKK